MDWAPGDLALCISDRGCPVRGTPCPYTKGCVYTVTSVKSVKNDFGKPARGIKTTHYDGSWWNIKQFRKVTPAAADAFDREVIAALNSEPVHARNNDAVHNSCQREDGIGSFQDAGGGRG